MPAIAAPLDPATDAAACEPFFYDVIAPDGTRLRAWTNDPDHQIDGPTVLLCNGLGTNPWTAPALLDRECGIRVLSWNHRGTGGSARPADRSRVGVEVFVEDALAILDDAGVDRATLMGWSIGVNTIFEFAVTHPERVNGLFALAGVPGGTFDSMLAPLPLPRALRGRLAEGATRLARRASFLLDPVRKRLRVGPLTVFLVTHSGFMLPVADPTMARRAFQEFIATPLSWYAHLALSTCTHARVSLSQITVPTAFVAGRWDVLASSRDMASAAARIPRATYVELRGSHFLALEKPDMVHDLLLEFLDRVE